MTSSDSHSIDVHSATPLSGGEPGGHDSSEALPPLPSTGPGHVVPPEEDIEERSIDERLYASWLTQIRSSSPSDADVDISARTRLIEKLVAASDQAAASEDRPSNGMPRAVGGPPREAAEGPVSLYRGVRFVATGLLLAAIVLSYEIVVPQQRAETYRQHMAAAVGELRPFNESYRDYLGGALPADLRGASRNARSAIAGVASFRRVVADEAPRRLPLVFYAGRPDPTALRAQAQELIELLDPLYRQVQLRAAFFTALGDYQEQVDILENLSSADGLEGEDKTVALKGIGSNLEAIRASLLGVAVPAGCEELNRRIVGSLDHSIATLKAAVGTPNSATRSESVDMEPIALAVARARAALTTPVREALPAAALDRYEAAFGEFVSRYGFE